MVERLTPDSGAKGPRRFLSKTLYSQKVLVIPRKQWLRPDMTEQLLTGTSSLNTNTQTNSLLISVIEF